VRYFLLLALIACSSASRAHNRRENGFPPTPPTESQPNPDAPDPTSKRLYERLGGEDGVRVLVDAFVDTLSMDVRINTYFRNTDVAQMKKLLNEQICVIAGGPCHYTGKDMKTAHTGMGVHGFDFDALIEDFTKAMQTLGIGDRDQRELLDKLQALRGEIVQKS
jgi:hemoglobin